MASNEQLVATIHHLSLVDLEAKVRLLKENYFGYGGKWSYASKPTEGTLEYVTVQSIGDPDAEPVLTTASFEAEVRITWSKY